MYCNITFESIHPQERRREIRKARENNTEERSYKTREKRT
jgi:hypothetical protein